MLNAELLAQSISISLKDKEHCVVLKKNLQKLVNKEIKNFQILLFMIGKF